MLGRLSEISFFVYGAVAAASLVVAGGVFATQGATETAEAVAVADAVDLAVFDPARHVTDNQATLLVQINEAYQFPITAGADEQKYLIPLFSAADDASATNVVSAVIVSDLVKFDAYLAQNTVGNARLGDLYAIQGTVAQAGVFEQSIANSMEMAGLDAVRGMTLLAPVAPVAAALPVVPMIWAWIAAAFGLAVLALGLVAQRATRNTHDAVSHRFQNLQGIVVPAE